jgi:ABC-2 type transport system permease protein
MKLQRIAAVARKEWRETTRDHVFLMLAFVMPVIWMVVFGYGLVLDVEDLPLAVVDYDRSALSRDYLYRFTESRYFRLVQAAKTEGQAGALLARGEVRVVVVVPERFGELLRAGQPVAVQTLIDGSFPLRTDIAKGYVIAINAAFSQERTTEYLARTRGLSLERAEQLTQPVTVAVRYLYNEEVRSTWSMVPALVMFTLMVSTPLLTALGVVREKETGSIYNIYSSTVSRVEFLIGKLAPYVAIATINLLVLWLLAVSWFQVPFKGSFTLFLTAGLLFVLTTTGIGLLISLLVMTQQAALIITMVVSMVPTLLFSGLIVPVSSLSPMSQFHAHLFPGMYFTNIVRGTFLKGVGFEILWVDLGALALYAGLLGLVGYHLFSKRPRA